jgi:hypothetical protein
LPHYSRLLGVLAVISCLGLPSALAADGAWKFQIDERDHPALRYLDGNGKTVLMVGCGHAFAIHAVYPGEPKKEGDIATITIGNGRTRMGLPGVINNDFDELPPNTTQFLQWDLGYSRQSPTLYETKWHQLENRLFDLLDSGKPLTISADGKSYELPAVDAPRWRRRFQKIC